MILYFRNAQVSIIDHKGALPDRQTSKRSVTSYKRKYSVLQPKLEVDQIEPKKI